ncbi:MAG TPA: hypothetical protein VGN42_24270 [Pirellulales bacterium]|jgi:hypothetical protein|nr:hypothetical protein [Pirellulales bacterium]
MKTLFALALLVGCLAPWAIAAEVVEGDAFAKKPTIKAPDFDAVHSQVMNWLAERKADEAARTAVEALWQTPSEEENPVDRLERTADSFALADPRAKSLVELASRPRSKGPLAPQAWLGADDAPAFERHNLRLFYGRWLAHEGLFDEALEQIADLKPEQVVDPASLLFYQAVAYHRLFDKEQGLETLARLLDETADLPARYASVAELMRDDLERLKEESLDHISRQMNDVRRRLQLGRAGKKVRKVEDDVIAALDKLIEDLEKKQQQSNSASSGAGGAGQPSKPMQDSRIAGARGAGDVNHRKLGNASGWGDLPAKQREEALQQIGKDFPSHYRDAIEQYFRKLASEKE